MRRGIAVGTAVVLVLEALTIAFVNWILGLVVQHQQMSMGGISHDAMATGSWVAGGVFALFLVVCAVLAARIAVTDRMTGRIGRIVLIVCAVVQGVVGALVIGIVGWAAFVLMMAVLGLLVATLLMYAPEDQPAATAGPTSGSTAEQDTEQVTGTVAGSAVQPPAEPVEKPTVRPGVKSDAPSPAAPPATA